jgi:chromosome segregation ATPase
VEPVQTNSRQIEIITRELEELKEVLSSQTMTIEEINGMLEGSLAEQRESIAELTAQVVTIDAVVIELEEGAKNFVTMEGRLDMVDDVLQEFGSDLEGFSVKLEETDTPSAKLSRQLQLIKAMELITRARFWFIQDNLGKARDDIQSAKEVVELVQSDGAESEVEVLAGIVERLDQALLAVELTPIVAADDLEIVWQLLILATEP